MKFNQFGRLTPDLTNQISELESIHFLPRNWNQQAPADLLAYLFSRCFPEVHENSEVQDREHRILVDAHTSLADLLAGQPTSIRRTEFYTAALQLLGFVVADDFPDLDSLGAMAKWQLPTIEADPIKGTDLVAAFYLLLNTRGKNGQTFLDILTSRGFFNQFFGAGEQPHFVIFNGKSQAVFDTRRIIREVVYVESDLDTDEDGQRDLLQTTIFRPRETEHGLAVPVLYTANPYFRGTNDMAPVSYNVNAGLTPKIPNQTTYEDIAYHAPQQTPPSARQASGTAKEASELPVDPGIYSLNDYFLARGFATVYAGGIGTRGSDGIRTTGGPEETASTIAIIEWLHGDRVAYTNRTDNVAIKAWWSTGNVAMTGKSYLGTLAIAAATTGVAGLKTVVSEAAISSWYDYYRENGLVVAPVDCQGEDTDVLALDTFSRRKDAADFARIKPIYDKMMADLKKGQDRDTGNYNTFWDARNYRNQADRIKIDFISVHGLEDWNVKPRNVERLWAKLRDLPINKKLFLHQGKHIYMNNMQSIDFTDMMNLWFCYELLDVQNDAPTILPNVTVQDNAKPETWHRYTDWSAPTTPRTQYFFTGHDLQAAPPRQEEIVAFRDDGVPLFLAGDQNDHTWEQLLMSQQPSVYEHTRRLFTTAPFTKDRYIDGVMTVTIQVAVNKDAGQISCMAVDYGKERRLQENPAILQAGGQLLGYQWATDDVKEFKLAKLPNECQQIAKGHMNLQNRHTPWQNEPLAPDQFVTLHFALQPTAYHLLAGHRLGLLVYATDMGMTKRPTTAATYQLDLNACRLEVPYRR
ncbi:Xaa-Pro dipeptidyl-peptidase [Schleiferilactobacillus perolens]|uniref:Xaa-Pro dipeptidyl-peptidase n=1 Tax=Schleiferilactobacillus perolens DSM 12744 TaxID=1423792 RepID=A0A0R1N978_9LACO|nr:Xaa-Pro dipeptidyl-peptidase [Schleiferilactobacillus perolens]KRL12920.1 xaa-Pro dipeptidyl-peptidase [Schleiferilactobacillus perolens DSM 12744]